MATPTRKGPGRTGNRLLDRLPPADLKALTGRLEPRSLSARQVVFQVDEPVDYLYFPVSGVLSLLVPPTADGAGVEVAAIGREGLVGVAALLGAPASFHQVACQVPGDYLRLPVVALAQAMARRPAVDRLIKKYAAVAYRTEIQGVVCNALHSVEQRVCRWLLAMADKACGEFPVTQDFLAARLGVQRPTVSLVAHALQEAGLIAYRRGLVRILDRAGLERSACQCFRVTKSVYERILDH